MRVHSGMYIAGFARASTSMSCRSSGTKSAFWKLACGLRNFQNSIGSVFVLRATNTRSESPTSLAWGLLRSRARHSVKVKV